jgi:glycosyltransferase involved in cell wall biosynthesis
VSQRVGEDCPNPEWCSPGDVSVVIPCYNCERTIERAVESVLSQTALPREIVLVDDCSTDGTAQLIGRRLEEWGRRCPTRLIRCAANGGPSRARNLGMDDAAGEWIAFLDSDDAWFPSKLEVQCRAASEQRAAFASHLIQWADASAPRESPGPAGQVRWLSYVREYFRNKVPTPSVLLRRSALRFDPALHFCEDHDFWLRYMKESGAPVLQVRERLCLCNPATHEGGLGGQLWPMYRGQLANFVRHRPKGAPGLLLCGAALALSFPAFLRRAAAKKARTLVARRAMEQ